MHLPTPNDRSRPDEGPANPGRRRLLAFGASATAASVAALGAAQAIESSDEQIDARYSRTAHVERYYALNRL